VDGRLRRVVEEDREFVPEGVGDEERDYAGLGGGGGEGGEGEEPEEEDAEGVHGWVVGNECGFVLSEWNGAGGARNETGGVAWGGFIYPNLFANFFSTGYGVENSNACLGGLATVSKAFSRLRARLTRRCSCEGRRVVRRCHQNTGRTLSRRDCARGSSMRRRGKFPGLC